MSGKTTFIVIHGMYGHHGENWFPYIKGKLENCGHRVIVPDFPLPPEQSLHSWSSVTDKIITNLDPSKVAIIGHSAGTIVAMYMAEQTQKPFKAIFIVCPFVRALKQPEGQPDFIGPLRTFVGHKFDWHLVRKGSQHYVCYAGENDPYVRRDLSQEVADKLGCDLKIIKNGGHLNEEAGYVTFPLLLSNIQSVCNL